MVNLFWVFLKLGIVSFGGPAAHIALMEEEFVHRRQWLSRQKFLDLVGLTQIIPGPNSTELAIHIGYLRAGWWGFAVAGLAFILPAFCIVTAVAGWYSVYGQVPEVHDFLIGAQTVVLAVILFAFLRFFVSLLGLKNSKELFSGKVWTEQRRSVLLFIVGISVFLKLRGYSEISILFTSALIALFIFKRLTPSRAHEGASLFLIFLKIGSLLFGSGYVLLSFLQSELIEKRTLITQGQLLDAITVGQFTPGPVFTTASFIGYIIDGFSGATMATLGIFLPAFIFVALSIPLYKRLESSHTFRLILDGIVAGSLGLLLFTLYTLGRSTILSGSTLVLLVVALVLLGKSKIPSAVLILTGGLCTYFFAQF
ncbi:MAG: chromate efflux transporter [Bdellovibrio sp.]|nr:chromate efflux transporter [Bdellovibrio sp.]